MARIKPVEFPILGTGEILTLRVTNYIIGSGTAEFTYEIYTLYGKLLIAGKLQMDAQAFAQWGTDDSYCIRWACQILGLEQSPEL